MDYEIIIIGAGVVGLSIASRLSEKNRSILVLEKNDNYGMETSSRNSEVIHAGIYYKTNSLKANLCVQGNRLLKSWCKGKNIEYNNIGKFIVAVNKEEEEKLDLLYEQALNNNVPDINFLSSSEVRREEPNIRSYKTLHSASTGIINSHHLMKSFLDISEMNGTDYAFRHNVVLIEKINGGYELTLRDPDGEEVKVKSEIIINSAGLWSDIIASLAGIDIEKNMYRLNWVKGHYFRAAGKYNNMVNHLIYPIPQKNLSGLGIHITKELDGSLKFGPDTLEIENGTEDYSVPLSLKEKFHSLVSSYFPLLEKEDIYPDQAGIRPKLYSPDNSFRDFIIREESDKGLPGFINLVGIESPGLTCCLSIAKMVENIV